MKLLTMELENFKAIKHFKLEANGNNKSIFGKNGVGKTTLADAYFWLLIDKSSLDKKLDEDIKLRDKTGNPEIDNGVEHKVTASFVLDNAKKITLSKVFHEKWVKQNGKSNPAFTGHVTDYFIDEVPTSKKDYQAFISDNICDIEKLKIISSNTFFCNMPWKKQREILLEACGDISDSDVIASDAQLNGLEEILNGKSVNDFIVIIKSRKAKINSELDKIPTRIDENLKTIESLSQNQNLEVIAVELKDFEQQKKAVEDKKHNLQITSGKTAIESKITNIKLEIEKIKANFEAENNKKLKVLNKELNTLNQEKWKYESEIARNKDTLEYVSSRILRVESAIEACRNTWSNERAKEFVQMDKCPTCGQTLSKEKIEEARNTFNKTKAAQLKECGETGKKLTEDKNNLVSEKAQAEQEITTAKNKITAIELKMNELKEKIYHIEVQTADKNETYLSLLAQKTKLEKDLLNADDSVRAEIQQLSADIQAIDLDINIRKIILAGVEQIKQLKLRIDKLKAEQKALSAEFDELEYKNSLVNIFIKNKVEMLTSKINSKFKLARFKLFKQQINGGLEDCCEAITINGSPYNTSMSNGEKVKIGIDIAETLAKHFGLNVPMFIDNAESVTELQETASQQIKLIVSHHDVLSVRD